MPEPASPRRGRRLLAVVALACCGAASAQTGATLHVPADHATIQAAIDTAVSGDTILVAPGVHAGPIVLDKAVTLGSHLLLTGDETAIARTILDGGGGSFVISVPAGTEDRPVIRGFTIQDASDGISPRAMLDVLDCVVRDTGDGIDFENGSGGLVQRCTFADNSDDGLDLDNAVSVVIADNDIRDNGDDGIEIRMQKYAGPPLHIVVTRNAIHRNGEDGIQLIHYNKLTQRVFEISYNTIVDNEAAGIGMMDDGDTVEDFRAADIPETVLVLGNTFVGNDHGISGGDAAVVLNNLFVGHATIATKQIDGASAIAYNLFHDNGVDDTGSNLHVLSTLFADPLLSPSHELLPGSPAIDAGTDTFTWLGLAVLALTPQDYAGAAPDLGALESDPGAGQPPAVPVLLSPPDGAADVALALLLDWKGDGDAFVLQLAADPAFTSIVLAANGTATRHVVPEGVLQPSTTYYWRVGALNSYGRSDLAARNSFTTTTVGSGP